MLVLLGPHVRRLGVARQPENAVSSVLRSSLVCTLGINLSHAPLAGLTHISSRHVAGFAHSCSEVCNGRLNRLARLASGNLLGGLPQTVRAAGRCRAAPSACRQRISTATAPEASQGRS